MQNEVKSSITINGQADPAGYRMIAALIHGAINDVPVAHLEFTARDKSLDLGTLVGTDMGFWVEDEQGKRQPFWGTCISAEAKGATHGEGHFVAEIRPWLWFLSRSRNNRIFQDISTTDIVKQILSEYGFSGDLRVDHAGGDTKRSYCVQYGETDLSFIKRLLEEEGFYFYFAHEDTKVHMVLADQPSTHGSAGEGDKYLYADENASGGREAILSWQALDQVVSGKVTLRDYDFTKPSSDLTASSEQPSGSHKHKGYEDYVYPGRYSDVAAGEKRAAARIEEHASAHQVWTAVGSILNLNVGKIFEITDHPRHEAASDNGFMVTIVSQFITVGEQGMRGASLLRGDPAYWPAGAKGMQQMFPVSGGAGDEAAAGYQFVQTVFDAVLKSKPYRGPGNTPRPRMVGVQTAVVTGASGDEINVDKYGRIKVQFHWDRDGKKDDKTTCWVRTMMPWTGKNWGMVALPRVGQEVVIQFEEGDPDRPICIGMLYNADTMPPYALPADATMSGIKTNSSKGGGGYNELVMEDKKGSELVRFMAEKDYVQNVQNQAHIKVGYGHPKDVRAAAAQDDKSMKVEVQNHLDEIVETGDHSFEVQAGKQTLRVKKDKTEKVEGKSILTVIKDKITKITQGNRKETVEKGNKSTSVKMGNISVKADMGKIDIEAMQSITLKVGGNSIKIDQMGITAKGMMVKLQGDMMLEAKAPMTTVKGDAMLTLKGGMTMIN